jgi:hypothetical protein
MDRLTKSCIGSIATIENPADLGGHIFTCNREKREKLAI